jgi:hypothetical protein
VVHFSCFLCPQARTLTPPHYILYNMQRMVSRKQPNKQPRSHALKRKMSLSMPQAPRLMPCSKPFTACILQHCDAKHWLIGQSSYNTLISLSLSLLYIYSFYLLHTYLLNTWSVKAFFAFHVLHQIITTHNKTHLLPHCSKNIQSCLSCTLIAIIYIYCYIKELKERYFNYWIPYCELL